MIIEQYISVSDYYGDLGESDGYRLLIFSDCDADRLRFVAPRVNAYSSHCAAINRNLAIGFWVNDIQQHNGIFLETVGKLYPELYDWLLFNPDWL